MRADSIRKINESYRASQQMVAPPNLNSQFGPGQPLPSNLPFVLGKDVNSGLTSNDPVVKRTVSEEQFQSAPQDIRNLQDKLFAEDHQPSKDTRFQYTKSVSYRDNRNTINLPSKDPRSQIQPRDYRMDPLAPATNRNKIDYSLLRDTYQAAVPQQLQPQSQHPVEEMKYEPVGPTSAAFSGKIQPREESYSQRAYQFQPSKVMQPNIVQNGSRVQLDGDSPQTCLKKKVYYCPLWFWILVGLIVLGGIISAIIISKRRKAYYPWCPMMQFWNGTQCVPVANSTQAANTTNATNTTNTTTSHLSFHYAQDQCPLGKQFLNGKCQSCPDSSTWNGSNCVRTK